MNAIEHGFIKKTRLFHKLHMYHNLTQMSRWFSKYNFHFWRYIQYIYITLKLYFQNWRLFRVWQWYVSGFTYWNLPRYILLVIVSYFERIEHDKHHRVQTEEVKNVTFENCLFASEWLEQNVNVALQFHKILVYQCLGW